MLALHIPRTHFIMQMRFLCITGVRLKMPNCSQAYLFNSTSLRYVNRKCSVSIKQHLGVREINLIFYPNKRLVNTMVVKDRVYSCGFQLFSNIGWLISTH